MNCLRRVIFKSFYQGSHQKYLILRVGCYPVIEKRHIYVDASAAATYVAIRHHSHYSPPVVDKLQ